MKTAAQASKLWWKNKIKRPARKLPKFLAKIKVFCLLFCLMAHGTGQAADFHMVDADVRHTLMTVARLGNFNLVIADTIKGTVTLHLQNVAPLDALKFIAAAKNFSLQHIGDAYIVSLGNNFDTLRHIHTFDLNYANPEEAAALIRAVLAEPRERRTQKSQWQGERSLVTEKFPAAQLTVDHTTNTLILSGTAAEAEAVRLILAKIDVPPRQVSLEAKIVAIEKEAAQKLGIEWQGTNSAISGLVRFGREPGQDKFTHYYEATLNALISDGHAKLLSRPNITTLQGQEATINIGGEVPVPTVSTTNSTVTTSINYREAGIILRYTPRIDADGYINANVHTEVSSPVYVDEIKAYRFQKRAADTNVRLRDGETMVIGGLIGSEESRNLSKIPFLGDLPILGSFFRYLRDNRQDSEIIIFLTAHVLD